MDVLSVHDVSVRYGPITAVSGASLSLAPSEIVALIGANGAGKSSLLRSIVGLAPVSAGTVLGPDGAPIMGKSPHWVAKHCGYAYVPEDRGIFARMTVRENLELGCYLRRKLGKPSVRTSIERMYQLFPVLRERQAQLAGTLSGGEQQMLAIGRALATEPRLILLDEPSLGLAPRVVASIFERLEAIRAVGASILLVEQNSELALRVSTRAYVLERGELVLSGPSHELAQDDRIRRAYLGLGVT